MTRLAAEEWLYILFVCLTVEVVLFDDFASVYYTTFSFAYIWRKKTWLKVCIPSQLDYIERFIYANILQWIYRDEWTVYAHIKPFYRLYSV